MARKKLGMRKIKEVFRLVEAGLSKSKIKQATGVSRKTIREYVQRSQSAGVSFADCQVLEESELIQRLYPEEGKAAPPTPNVADWEWVHQEMKRKSVTLRLLWEELKEKNAQLCGYRQFCRHYGTWKQTVPITDPKTGEIRQAQVFVATLGANAPRMAGQSLQDV
jgi:transposase